MHDSWNFTTAHVRKDRPLIPDILEQVFRELEERKCDLPVALKVRLEDVYQVAINLDVFDLDVERILAQAPVDECQESSTAEELLPSVRCTALRLV